MEQKRKRRYYSQGEKVWVKDLKKSGVIKELDIRPKENVYKATVEVTEEKGKTIIKTVRDYDLWELDKFTESKDKKPVILFAKVRPSAIIPSKEDGNAGYDLYADFEEDYITLEPNTVTMIPTGIASSVKEEYALIIKERGSTGTKAMSVRAGI